MTTDEFLSKLEKLEAAATECKKHYFDDSVSKEPMFAWANAKNDHFTTLIKLVREYKEALLPFSEAFAKVAKFHDGKGDQAYQDFLDSNTITPTMCVGDFRRARSALEIEIGDLE